MEINAYFENIEDVIIEDIKTSKKQLLIATAWFTNKKIFDAIIDKLINCDDFAVKLIVINDNINNRIGGLDFQKIVSAGGNLYFAEKNIPMHNKYIVIDSNIVITGSYNYTYYAESYNEENIIRITGGGDIIQSYIDNFNSLVSGRTEVKNVNKYLNIYPPFADLFSYNHYALKDLSLQTEYYRQIGNEIEARELTESFEKKERKKDLKQFCINDIIYKQWKSDYYIDRIEVRAKKVKITFRTIISDGCYLCSPNTRSTWNLQSSNDNNINVDCYAVRNVLINDELIINQAQKGTIYRFYENEETNDFSENSCGYEINADKKMVDSNGNIIPVRQIKISPKTKLTCEVFFKVDKLELTNGSVDFVEGRGFENDENHWNAFNIKMYLNREKL